MVNSNQKSLVDIPLFSGEPQLGHLGQLQNMMPVVELSPSNTPHVWPVGEKVELPERYVWKGESRSVPDFIEETDTVALLVLSGGKIRFEEYWHTGGPSVPWMSFSVGKSFTSALVGVLVDEQKVASIDDPISDYVDVEPGSAYDGVSIRNILTMSSGARWDEEYGNPESDIMRLLDATAGSERGLDWFVANMAKERGPGSYCRYNSGESQILGALIRAVTGQSMADYAQEKLLEPLGFEYPGYLLVDGYGVELAFGGHLLTARDFAKLGELYRLGGEWAGQRILSQQWVTESTTLSVEPHLAEVEMSGGKWPIGYGYQWWLPHGERGDFSAIGVYNQYIYVDPSSGTTIVKLSANQQYGTSGSEDVNRDMENIAFLRAIADTLF